MAERVYPSSKPTLAAAPEPAFPATKAQLYNASRPAYRPQPRRRRSRCCSCCLWTTLVVVLLILLAGIATAALWLVYQPHKPTFTVSNFKISTFNLTSSSHLNSNFSLSVFAKNRNKKITFDYLPVSVSISSDKVPVGDGSFPSFILRTKNTTVLKTEITSSSQVQDATLLKSELKNKNLKLKIEMNSKVRVKIGKMKTKRVRVRVTCDKITATVPSGKTATIAETGKAKCKVDLRVKIWKWTI